ncbi:MAG: acetylxylan esterase [Lentisphaeria bacterium]|nr:acetylxylan esterase [Lentisphaeria bacterium]
MNREPSYISRAREVQAQVGENREEFLRIFSDIYADTTNFDPALVPPYTLPSPLELPDGRRVKTASEWMNSGRRVLFDLFSRELYGKILPRPDEMSFEILTQKEDALDGAAIRQEIRITCGMASGKRFSFDMLLYIPRNAGKKVPAFLGLNFKGNHGCTHEPDVTMTPCRFNDSSVNAVTEITPAFYQDSSRGIQAHRWCFEEVVKRGYASATICYEDIFPDRPNGWENSCCTLFGDFAGYTGGHETYSAVGAWAWGLSRGLDLLENHPLIDASRVCLHGHSRLGKTALWEGAADQRFKMVVSNDSGCLGAALSRRVFGENFFILVNYRPHWFVKNARKYINNEQSLPFDQHGLIALAAPRPVVIASAVEDHGADPEGEFLAARGAGEVYALFGSAGLPCCEMPLTDEVVTGDISYHIRTGCHDQTPQDWAHYLEIADRYL